MNIRNLLRAGSVTALAAALTIGALPVTAQDEDRRGRLRENRSGDQRAERPQHVERAEARQERRAQRAEQPAQAPRVVQRPQRQWQAQAQSPVAQERSGRDWNRSDRRSGTGAERSGLEWNRRDNTSNDWGQARAARAQAEAQSAAQARAAARTSGGWERNRTYSDRDRNQTYRNGYRDGRRTDSWRDNRQQQNAYREGYRDGDRSDDRRWDGNRDGRRYSGDHRRWNNHDWRRDNRYNWYSYRNANRSIFRLGSYYSPYRDYRYSRLSIGFRLGSLFYGSRYWINDPWQYRLPAAYGPYRWVRYYDDALLVDIYSGEVVDVVYDFFW
ncbi:RcnB family protein [Tsuneonella sp. HG249]